MSLKFTLRAALLMVAGHSLLSDPTQASPQRMGTHADLPAIDAQIAEFTGAERGEIGGAILPVDRRLRLAPCLAELNMSWRNARHDSLLVQCPTAGGWKLFVPIKPAVIAPVAAVVAPLRVIAVARGEVVSVAVNGEGFTVSQPGEAMEAGALGEWVRVRMVKEGSPRGEPMRAQVVRPGLLAVPLP
jgi:flagellar basal body P-ring formation protein FlgA